MNEPMEGARLDIDVLLQDADTLPAFPSIVTEILARIDDPLSVPDDFTEIISRDQVMVSKVLKFANSAFYGFPRTIVTLKEAVIILGLDTLKSIVLAISSYSTLNANNKGYGLDKGGLYQHSICCAMIARILAKKYKSENKEKFFIAALLHDVGKLLLDPWLSRFKTEMIDGIRKGNLAPWEAERRVLGFDHAFVGSKLIEGWNLPEVLIHVTRYHHTPEKAPLEHRAIVEMIQAANIISRRIRGGLGGEFIPPEGKAMDELQHVLPLAEDEVRSIVREVRTYLLHINTFI
ncbi:MAG TPA: HDOD domain-containing protein [Spirochaetota bacterium]|nr:HDOD domain-containing protein [Spirochaetota bacterium]HPH01775.1 HDOD domain-containing protein [Spirochaetota bacterium]HPN83361.1 HDOD domain-containing protein [Spirochaetota bacterium]